MFYLSIGVDKGEKEACRDKDKEDWVGISLTSFMQELGVIR